MKKIRVLIGLVLAVLVFRWVTCGTDDRGRSALKDLTNRVWVDKAREGPRDQVLHLALLSKRRLGVVFRASRYRSFADQLRYRLSGRQLTLLSLQDQEEVTFQAKTWRCDDAPPPYDLCLELKAGRRSLRMYSRRNRTMTPADLPTEMAPDPAAPEDGKKVESFNWFVRAANR